jgi:hypothetical protein
VERLEIAGGLRSGKAPAALTLLDGAINNAVTTLTVDATTGYPTAGTLLIDNEAMTYTGVTATTFTGLTRGVLGTAAAAHNDNATVSNYLMVAQGSATTPKLVVTGEGSVGIGTVKPNTTDQPDLLSIVTENSGAMSLSNHMTSSTETSRLIFQRSAGTAANPTDSQRDYILGRLDARGYGAGSFQRAAYIQFEQDGGSGGGDMPGRITFGTTPDGSSSPIELAVRQAP